MTLSKKDSQNAFCNDKKLAQKDTYLNMYL